MLQVFVPSVEMFNDETGEFVQSKDAILKLEHSLISMSKWESKWHKPFLETKELTDDEAVDYIRCMTLNSQNIDESVYSCLTVENFQTINAYIDDPMTATWFNEADNGRSSNRRITTAEIIYSQMISLGIPFECEKWHLNRLLTLIKVCALENSKETKKMSRDEILRQNRELNEKRKAAAKTKG